MKTVFDLATRNQLITRINLLDKNSKPQWGRMNVVQMLQHCILCEEMYLGKRTYKRSMMGRIFGKMAIRNLLKDDNPMQKNAPTSPYFKIKETEGDVESGKERWIALIEEYAHYSNPSLVHWFFGEMSKEQVGFFVYKHTDHHLRQFNV